MSVDPNRQAIRQVIAEVCEKYAPWMQQDQPTREYLVVNLEKGCLNLAYYQCKNNKIPPAFDSRKPWFTERYSAVCSKLIANLDTHGSVGSSHLIDKLIAGEIRPMAVAEMTSKDMCPEASARERAEIEARLHIKTEIKVSRSYVCRKCNANETELRKYQSRAADEDNTISARCINCGNSWQI